MKKDARVLIAVSKKELEHLKKKAEEKGLSLSAYLRMRGLE